MLFTLSTTHRPATDLGFLLHKSPWRPQRFALTFGVAHVLYPEARPERCTAALALELDPVGLVRGRRGPGASEGPLEPYVNDRPYVASSFLSVAIAQVFGSALAGRSHDRPELARAPLDLEASVACVPCRRGGPGLVARLFGPLGYEVEARAVRLDDRFEGWGDAPYVRLVLRGRTTVRALLTHLYVLLPVLDDEKHYWVGEDEVDKLVRRGEGWLGAHPERELVAGRYLKHSRRLTRLALRRLVDEGGDDDPDASAGERDEEERAVERPLGLDGARRAAVCAALEASGARSVVDLGCGEGKLLGALLERRRFERVAGVDVSARALAVAAERLRLDRAPAAGRARVELWQSSLAYRDRRLEGFDAAACVEVIEHVDPHRLPFFTRNLFEFVRPGALVVTTPNVEYNARLAGLPAGARRHRDHRFEWTRAEFGAWARAAAAAHGYAVELSGAGAADPALGAPTQLAVFRRTGG
jgi:3' terminal RNA ribose 2'-O-methyltransferase Hen1